MTGWIQRFRDIPDAKFRTPALVMLAVLAIIFCSPAMADHSVAWHDEKGVPVLVAVYNACAFKRNTMAYAFVSARQIYLCHNDTKEPHELAHIAGMKHSAWRMNPEGGGCTTVTEPGFQTGYRKGDVICVGNLGRGEFVER